VRTVILSPRMATGTKDLVIQTSNSALLKKLAPTTIEQEIFLNLVTTSLIVSWAMRT